MIALSLSFSLSLSRALNVLLLRLLPLQDLQQAYDTLGCSSVTLKPVRGGASPGEGVLRCTSKLELSYYDFPLGRPPDGP